MRVFTFTAILLLIILTTHAAPTDYYNRQSLTVDVDIRGTLTLVPLTDRARIINVTTDLYFHPINDEGTQVTSVQTQPTATQTAQTLQFNWDSPTDTTLTYIAQARVKTLPTHTRITTKTTFPIHSSQLPTEVIPYLSPTPLADFDDPRITNLAWELSANEDDLYVIVNTLAAWVHDNIQYNLSTATVSASIKASQVLTDRAGVCDELTNLFIALNRALGIPARFVSGLAYTDSTQFSTPWGAHGWAEVYFPGTGWVAFDPTFGQYGWVDSTHIKLKESQDASEPSTKVQWTGTDVDLELTPLDFLATVIETGPQMPASIALSVEPSHERVRIGSHNSILAIAENPKPYYQSIALRLANTQGIDIIGPQEHVIALAPGESKATTFTIRVDPNLDPTFDYTFPILITTERNHSATTTFHADKHAPTHTSASIHITPTTLRTIDLSCQALPVRIRIPDPVLIECTINELHGTGELCSGNRCVGITGKAPQKARLTLRDETPGEKTATITLRDSNGTRNAIARYHIADIPNLHVTTESTPHVTFDDVAHLGITLSQTSVSIPQRITTRIQSPTITATYPIDTFSGSHQLDISIPGKTLAVGENELTIIAEWQDEKGAQHTAHTTAHITLANVTLWQSIQVALNKAGNWILSLLN